MSEGTGFELVVVKTTVAGAMLHYREPALPAYTFCGRLIPPQPATIDRDAPLCKRCLYRAYGPNQATGGAGPGGAAPPNAGPGQMTT